MASIDDIDTESAVRKFLERDVVVDREDEAVDSSSEVTAILESVAVSFLLYPQTALSFVLMAKNALQQVLTVDLSIVDFLYKAVDDVDNPDETITDTSDLVEAQTALVEVDRLGRLGTEVKAYTRYTAAVNRFLNWRLAKSLKRRRRIEFERTGLEAKQDIFSALPSFGAIHELMSTHLNFLDGCVADFTGIDLTRLVSTKTVARVRSSLRRVLRGVQSKTLSNTSVAIELLAGAAALDSISATRKVYDPTVDTGNFPLNRNITASSESVVAMAESGVGPFDLSSIASPHIFGITTDPQIDGGTSYSVHLPCDGAVGRAWTVAKSGMPTYVVPAGRTLYVQFDGPTPPVGTAVIVRAVPIPSGSAVLAETIVTALNHVTTGLLHGVAVTLANTGRILIYGNSDVTKITIRSIVPGSFSGINYIPAVASAHAILGFSDDQMSGVIDSFTVTEVADLLGAWVPTASFTDTAEASGSSDGTLLVSSLSTSLLSSLRFSGPVAALLGFGTAYYEAEASYLELMEDGVAVDPTELGVYVGSLVSVSDVDLLSGRNLSSVVIRIEDAKLFFDTRVPRCSQSSVTVTAPIVFAVQKLLTIIKPFLSVFANDALNLQRVTNPLMYRPTLAQMNDAKKVLLDLRTRLGSLRTLLTQILVREDGCQYAPVARQVVASLQERGLDRALELLERGQFSDFFALTPEVASKGSRFLNALERIGRTDYATTTVEADMRDPEPVARSQESAFRGEELSDNRRG